MKKTLFLIVLFITALTQAQTVTWIGGTGAWNLSNNWDSNIVPGPGSNVIIPTGSTVNITASAIMKSITVNGNAVVNINGNVTFTNASTFGSNTTINWSNSTIMGGGTLSNLGTINLPTDANKILSNGTTINNSGTMNINGTGSLYLTNSTVNNQMSGIFNMLVAGGNITYTSSVSELFNNAGVLNRSGEIGIASINCTMTNSGTINVTQGELQITDTENQFNGGIYNVSTNATLLSSGTTTLTGTLTGLLQGNFSWTGTFKVPAAAALNFTGPAGLNWNSGILSGGGTLTQKSVLNLVSEANKIINGTTTLSNTGTINIASSGSLYLTNSTLNNQAGGNLNFKATGGNITYTSSSTEMVNNFGTINRSGEAGLASIVATMKNTGTINATVGTLEIADSDSQLNGGVYNVSADATLLWSSNLTCSGTLTGAINGTLNWAGSVIVPVAATFNFSGPSGVSWSSGSISGAGTLTNNSVINLVSDANKIITTSTLSNVGTISILSSGNLYLTNAIINNQINGILNLKATGGNITYTSSISEMLNNFGTINRNGQSGLVSIIAAMKNTGTINATVGTLEIANMRSQLNGGIYNASSGATLLWSSTITCSGTLTGNIAGTLDWSANVVVPAAATFNFTGPSGVSWNSGSLTGAGVLNNSSTINLLSDANKSIGAGMTLNNASIVNIKSAGILYLTNSTFNNLLAGTLNLMATAGNISYISSTTELLNNLGTINRSVAVGLVTILATMKNSGTINVTSGILEIADSQSQFNGGTYNVNPSCTLRLSQTVTCSGTLTGVLNGPMAWEGTINVVAANPATFNFTGSNSVNWNYGTFSGGGVLTNKSKFLLTTAANKGFSGSVLNNEGAITLEDSGSLYFTNATLNNKASGIINLSSNAAGITYTSSTLHVINNYGLIKKSIQNGTTSILVNVNNYNLIDASLGVMKFDGSLTNAQTGTVIGIATLDLPSPANFSNNGTFAPGGTPGVLTVIGDYKSTATSILAVDLNGLTSGTQYDVLAIQGDAIMDGSVEITLGFAPVVGNTFTIATTTGVITLKSLDNLPTAIFNGSRYSFTITYPSDNKVLLTVSDVQLGLESNTISEKNLLLYPNPANEVITLRNDSGKDLNEILLFNISGQLLKTIPTSEMERETEINLNGTPSGVYFLKIKSEDGTVTKRFVKD